MDYKVTHLNEKNRINLACDYLVHEFRKIFRNLSYDDVYGAIKNLAPTNDSDDVAFRDFWNLFCAVSSGWRLKDLFNIVTNENIEWKKERISINQFIPQDMHGWMKNFSGSSDFSDWAISYFQGNSQTLNDALKDSEQQRGNRANGDENDPIIAIKDNACFKVIDGNSRLKLRMEKLFSQRNTSSPPQIEAWLGYPTKGQSNFWIPTSYIFYFRDYFFRKYKINNLDIETFFESISRLSVMEYKKRVKQ